jgi:hypothetical protein
MQSSLKFILLSLVLYVTLQLVSPVLYGIMYFKVTEFMSVGVSLLMSALLTYATS